MATKKTIVRENVPDRDAADEMALALREKSDELADIRTAIEELLAFRIGRLPNAGHIRDCTASRRAIAKLVLIIEGC